MTKLVRVSESFSFINICFLLLSLEHHKLLHCSSKLLEPARTAIPKFSAVLRHWAAWRCGTALGSTPQGAARQRGAALRRGMARRLRRASEGGAAAAGFPGRRSGGGCGNLASGARPRRQQRAPSSIFFIFYFFCSLHTIFFKKNISRVFYLDVHFLFLPFDKFLSVKIFLVKFFLSHQFVSWNFFLPTNFSLEKLFGS